MDLALGAIALLIIGIMFYTILSKQEKEIGFLSGKLMYTDIKASHAEILKASTIPLIGKPDSIVKHKGQMIPVEVKTGKTPKAPYLNHTMQLMAYCLLVEEHFHKRPPGGYLHYPQKKFKLSYTKEAEESVRSVVAEIIQNKRTHQEFHCTHPEHNK